MAIAAYAYGFEKLDRSGTGFSVTEGYSGLMVIQSGRDYFGISGDLDTSGGPLVRDVVGTIEKLSWSNANGDFSLLDDFLEIEGANVDYQDFLVNTAMDLSFFFQGNDDVTGSSENDLLLGQLSAGDGNDIIHLNDGNDIADAGAGDDLVHGGNGDDLLFGGDGTDTARFEGHMSRFSVTIDGTSATITERGGSQGTDDLINFETLEFVYHGDITAFDIDAYAGLAQLTPTDLSDFVELYIAYFNRAPDALGLAFWGTAFADGMSRAEIASLFTTQDETQATYPANMSNEAFAEEVYGNVLGRTPDQDGFAFWVDAL